ncbi:hypothetical protein [Arthrobacter sp. A5]|uniref:hypothetical protein n=1 Tax=Arthrobacter sp. A5 TaxID=576926 RepID=UPI003DA7C7CD
MSDRPSAPSGGPGGIPVAVGAVALAVICCAGPVLIAGGGLAVAGGVLGNPVVLAIGALIVAGAVAFNVSRRRARARTSEALNGQSDGWSSAAEGPSPKMADYCGPEKTGANGSGLPGSNLVVRIPRDQRRPGAPGGS